jgi:hypothetical protein
MTKAAAWIGLAIFLSTVAVGLRYSAHGTSDRLWMFDRLTGDLYVCSVAVCKRIPNAG